MDKNHYCIIMAGGIGSRFWPASRNSKPKQFLDILGTGKTFIQQTYERFLKVVPKENILVVTSAQYEALVKEQLPDLLPENILLEPYRKNTAPCIAYAAYKLDVLNPNASMVVAPSDHLILNEDEFTGIIKSALEYTEQNDSLITLGIKPTRLETAYGYIQYNKKQSIDITGSTAYKIKTFTEKPNVEMAKVFIDSGEFLWNSGIFIWNLRTIKGELERYQSEIASLFAKGGDIYNTYKEVEFIENVYEACPNISIDYGIMEKTDKAIVYPASFGWSDLGTWESLYVQLNKDDQGRNNAVKAERVMLNEVTDSLIISDEPGKLIVASNLEGYMIVNTEDVLMICPRDEATFKNIITDLVVKELSDFQ
jgi:Mannose-1-phosphate guanylyltransferase